MNWASRIALVLFWFEGNNKTTQTSSRSKALWTGSSQRIYVPGEIISLTSTAPPFSSIGQPFAMATAES